ncbi:hypothetical protein KL905_004232 [Ogataea polymorpha]|nr:hypothetical protein KL937_003669 [Ogataea polymorpha]KAG7907245.1 hypothetical protein KL906_003932 [Ogataea polymorpha]KAG7918153.1 hypothetical protein KL905_004232 [Ogataea polymorpha]KAG7932470.1 hypothetical protein KL934_003913 [Ogataea polymorpha]KAG7933777.1 hypothetical protein KL904_004037 [Ogataea polymorpha]
MQPRSRQCSSRIDPKNSTSLPHLLGFGLKKAAEHPIPGEAQLHPRPKLYLPQISVVIANTMSSQSLPNGTAKPQMPLSSKKNRKLRRKAAQPQPILKYAWLAGHVSTLLFGFIYLCYYVVRKSHKSWVAFVGYRLAWVGVWISYSVAIASHFNRKSLPSYFTLMTTENFQYLVLSVHWFLGWSSFFKLLPYLLIATLQLSNHFKIKPLLRLEPVFKKTIIYNELFLFVLLTFDTLCMKGNSGFGLVSYAMFYWLRLLHSEDNRFFVYSVISKLDTLMSKQKNPTILEAWDEVKKFLSEKQSKFESQYLAV